MRCCSRSISARRMWWASSTGHKDFRHASCRETLERFGLTGAKEKTMARLISSASLVLSLVLVAPQGAAAQSYPTHPIRIIVSSAAGGPLDVICRAVAEKISVELKQPVVVESRTGAGGNLAADFVGKSAPDGYTLLFTLSTTLTVNPYLYKDLNFNLKPITV